MTEFLYPVRIVAHQGVSDPENLLKKQSLQIGISETKTVSFEKDGYVILDFGKELCGSLRILTVISDGKVRIRFGESLTECCSDLGGEKNATNDHALRDFAAELPNLSDMTFGNTGFRFVRVDFLKEATVKTMVAVNRILKKKALYSYEGKDTRIKAIYETAKRTVDLCAANDYVWDGVKRDRLVWIGDLHPEMLALTTLYGRLPEIERSLEFVKEQTPLPNWMNNIPMYSMWWIIILGDYYEKTGAKAFVKKQMPYLEGLVDRMLACVQESGEMDYPGYFVDWPTKDTPDAVHGSRAINIMAAKKAIYLLKAMERDTKQAEELLQRLVQMEITSQSKQVLGLKHFAVGLTEADQKKLTADGAKRMSTFMSYYILKAVASFDKKTAIAMMKEYYGAMLDKGATTFWEDFSLDWAENSCRIDEFPREGQRDIHGDFGAFCYVGFRHSLCHGWSAGVIQFIKEECEI